MMKKTLYTLLSLGLGFVLSAQSLGTPTNPFSSTGAPDALGAASTGRKAAPAWNNQQSFGQGQQQFGQTPKSSSTQSLTGKVVMDAWGTVGLTVGKKQYLLAIAPDTLASMGLKSGDTVTVQGQILQARTGNVSLVLVSNVTSGGRTNAVSQAFVADRRGSFQSQSRSFDSEDDDGGRRGESDDRD